MSEKTFEPQKLINTALTDMFTRWTQAMDELAKFEAKNADQVRTAVDELGRLAKVQLEYTLKLTGELRELSVSALKKAATATAPASTAPSSAPSANAPSANA